MNEDTLNLEIRKFLKEVGITSQREIEKVVRSGKVRGDVLQLRMTLDSQTAQLNHVVECTIELDGKPRSAN
jgi:16S rRNA U516 pseudouridylate synthase RsuA-like enzyme